MRHGCRPASAGALNVNAYAPGAAWRSRPQSPPRAPDRLAQLRAVYGQTIGPALRGAGDVDGALLPPRGVYVGAGMSMRDGDGPVAGGRPTSPPRPATEVRVAYAAGAAVGGAYRESARSRRQAYEMRFTTPMPPSEHRAGWGARAARHGGGAMEQVFAKARELARLYENAHLAIESDQALRGDMLRGLMDEGVV